jgi:hypothetical protein
MRVPAADYNKSNSPSGLCYTTRITSESEIKKRKTDFHQKLVEIVANRHNVSTTISYINLIAYQNFLKQKGLDRYSKSQWHPSFPLEELSDIEESELFPSKPKSEVLNFIWNLVLIKLLGIIESFTNSSCKCSNR